jgi:hypothetical protein
MLSVGENMVYKIKTKILKDNNEQLVLILYYFPNKKTLREGRIVEYEAYEFHLLSINKKERKMKIKEIKEYTPPLSSFKIAKDFEKFGVKFGDVTELLMEYLAK